MLGLHVLCMAPIPHERVLGFYKQLITAAFAGNVRDAEAMEGAICRGTSEDHEKHPDRELQAQTEPDP